MSRIGNLLNRLLHRSNRTQPVRGLEHEIRFHIEMETRDRMETGLTEQEARRQALTAFGSVPQCQENVRETFSGYWWTELQRDFRYAFRTIRRRPGFAALTVFTLALGIGANTAVFSVFDRAVLRPLPY